VFDKNSDGYIDEQELQQTMKELGVTLSSDDVAAMFTEAGCKDQRRITYEGFRHLFSIFMPLPDISGRRHFVFRLYMRERENVCVHDHILTVC